MRLRPWVLLALLALSCTSPTLPLPPPALPTVFAGSAPNTFVLRSDRGSLPNALVIAVNRNEGLPRTQRVAGTIADGAGSWELTMTANAGDLVDISQESGATQSPPVTVELK